jgi:hypothetical protein
MLLAHENQPELNYGCLYDYEVAEKWSELSEELRQAIIRLVQ